MRRRLICRLPRLAGLAALLGLLAHALLLYAVTARPGSGLGDRVPGLAFARHRQAQLDASAADRPAPQSALLAAAPARAVTVLPPEPGGAITGEPRASAALVLPPSGSPRSPPAR